MRDTVDDVDAMVVEAIRRTSPAERVAQALIWSEQVRELALQRLRALHPGRSDHELVALMLDAPSPVPVRGRTPLER